MKTKLLPLTMLSLFVAVIAFGNPAPYKKMMEELKLTDAQKEQFEKISFETQKKQIELNAKVETAKLELRRLMMAESIDKSAIEKKMNDIAVQEVALRMNRLNAWSENNKALTPEQQKNLEKKFNASSGKDATSNDALSSIS